MKWKAGLAAAPWRVCLPEERSAQRGRVVFELCAESLEPCLLARAAGVGRIELCTALVLDGLTPSHGLTRAAVEQSGVPVFELLRPRAGDFVYSEAEFQVMQENLRHGKAMGVSGFALGLLLPDGRVDVERTQALVRMAEPLEVTFHRAFDATPSLPEALEDVIATGCRRVLTSGGAASVLEGAAMLAALVEQAAGRIEIAVGGGLRAENAAEVARRTGATHFHGSVRRGDGPAVDAGDLRRMMESLHEGAGAVRGSVAETNAGR